MERSSQEQAQPQATPDAPMVPDVATQAHPTVPAEPALGAGDSSLQNVLPAIKDVAQKVGGFKKLAEIANTLSETGK